MIRVASAPHGHVYVEHLAALDADDGVRRLPDPTPDHPVVGAPWWPLVMLDPAWLDTHAGSFDLFHLHFGFDALTPAELTAIVETLRANGRPLVYTAHDLRNPHHLDRAAHDAALGVLVPAADEVITLTPGAAAEIAERWGRTATVIPHPHVVPLDELDRPRPPHDRPTVGIHLKSMRASLNPLPMLAILAEEAPRRGVRLVVDVHDDVVDPAGENHDPRVVQTLAELSGRDLVTVHAHGYYSDEELWDYFQSLDLSVLPYRFGTHSGWLEACYDLGTPVLAPHLGHFHEQEPGVHGYAVDASGDPDPAGVVAVLDRLASEGLPPWRAEPAWRREQRTGIAAAHRAVYERALDRTPR